MPDTNNNPNCRKIKRVSRIGFDKINIEDSLIILICGGALILSITYSLTEISCTLGGGLIGYLSKRK